MVFFLYISCDFIFLEMKTTDLEKNNLEKMEVKSSPYKLKYSQNHIMVLALIPNFLFFNLLLLSNNLETFCVYDLVSKKHIILPRNNIEAGDCLSLGFECEERGTNHHPHLCYKVVCVDTRSEVGLGCTVEIYSSETGIWQKSILKTWFRSHMKSHLIAKVIGGVFHWYLPIKDAIIAYDSEDRKGRAVFIELPPMGNNLHYRESMALFEGTKDGSLQFICIGENDHINVWIITSTSGQSYMDDDIVCVSKWILTSSVSLFDIGVGFGDIDILMQICARAISADPVDPHIVYLEVGRKLYAYDYRQGKVVFTYSQGLTAGTNVFVPFEWPTWPCL